MLFAIEGQGGNQEPEKGELIFIYILAIHLIANGFPWIHASYFIHIISKREERGCQDQERKGRSLVWLPPRSFPSFFPNHIWSAPITTLYDQILAFSITGRHAEMPFMAVQLNLWWCNTIFYHQHPIGPWGMEKMWRIQPDVMSLVTPVMHCPTPIRGYTAEPLALMPDGLLL